MSIDEKNRKLFADILKVPVAYVLSYTWKTNFDSYVVLLHGGEVREVTGLQIHDWVKKNEQKV